MIVAIQLAHLSGFFPIITTASEKHTEFLTSLGASHVLSRSLSTSDLQISINSITSGKPIRTLYDAISTEDTQNLGATLLAPGGTLVIVLPQVVTEEILKAKNLSLIYVFASLRAPFNV